jgi:hypothetical protein
MPIPRVIEQVCAARCWPRYGDVIEIELEGGRTQRIAVNAFTDDDEEMIRISTGIGDAAELPESRLRAALGVNARLPHGALAIDDGQLVLSDTFLTRHAAPDHVERSLRFLAETADRYEKVLFGTDSH